MTRHPLKLAKTAICLFIGATVLFSINIAAEETSAFDIHIVDRQVTADTKLVRVTQGDEVVMLWHTDEAVSVHLHGYDIELEVKPGEPARMAFSAHATGRFPVTSHGFAGGDDHHGHQTLLYFEVHPE